MKNYLKTYFFDILFKKFFDCTGKADRKEFWLFTLNLLVCISAIYAVIYFDFPKISPILFEKSLNIYPSYDTIIFLQIIFSLIILFPVLFLLPFINLLARRLHDIGLSAKYLFLAIFFIRYARFLPFIIGIIGCIPGKKEGNKYDEQNIKNNTIKKIFMNGTILILILLFFYSFPYALTKGMRQKKASCNQLINDIAKAQLKYFKENNDFLYVYETDRSDILNIDLQNDDGVDKFSCTVNTDDIDNKSVEIKVWAKIDDKRKEKLKGTYYLGYISATQYQDGKLSRMMLNLDKKTAE